MRKGTATGAAIAALRKYRTKVWAHAREKNRAIAIPIRPEQR